jgi:hypothetical protein
MGHRQTGAVYIQKRGQSYVFIHFLLRNIIRDSGTDPWIWVLALVPVSKRFPLRNTWNRGVRAPNLCNS